MQLIFRVCFLFFVFLKTTPSHNKLNKESQKIVFQQVFTKYQKMRQFFFFFKKTPFEKWLILQKTFLLKQTKGANLKPDLLQVIFFVLYQLVLYIYIVSLIRRVLIKVDSLIVYFVNQWPCEFNWSKDLIPLQ